MPNEAAIGKSLEIANSDSWWTYEAAGYYLPQKKALFFAFFDKTRANTHQVLPVQTGLYRSYEWMVLDINDRNHNGS